MSDYRVNGPHDEAKQRTGDYPDGMQQCVWTAVNNRLPADKLPVGVVADAMNVRMRTGDIEPRLGVVKPGWLNALAAGRVVSAGTTLNGAGVFADPATREWVLLAADGNIYACAPGNVRHAIPLPVGVRIAGPCSFAQAFNQCFVFRGRYLRPLVLRSWLTGFEDVVAQWAPGHKYLAAILATERSAEEMAYGPFLTITSLVQVDTTVTATTSQPHGYITGADIVLRGVNGAQYCGRFNITVLDNYRFSYAAPAGGDLGGSPLCSNMSRFWQATGDVLTLATGALISSGTTATVTSAGHGLVGGEYVTVAGATPAGYNGLYQVQTVPDADHFTYTLLTGGLTTPATGAITVTKSTVAAGHTPDSHPASWTELFNVLPNADEAVYMNGRLLVPTAYTPGDNGYDSTSSWTKKDYLVALDVFDPVHFRFTNGFRINQGDDSEITNVVKYDASTAVVTKGKRWGVLSNLQNADLSTVTFDERGGKYGCPAVRSALVAGKDVFFPASGRGLVSVAQTSNGVLQGVDLPFSADVPAWVRRINWNAVDQQRLQWWNNYLFWAVAVDTSSVNNAVLVYDFQNRGWVSFDQGVSVKEFLVATYNGRERLFSLGHDGWVNLHEEATAGDQTATGWAEIPTDVTLNGDLYNTAGQKNFPMVELAVGVWNASFTVTVTSGGMRTVRTPVKDKTFSRTHYLKPFDRAPYNELNLDGRWSEPNRGDYSVRLLNGMNLAGCSTLQFQELFLRPSTKNFRASYALIRIQNTRGRLNLKQVTPVAQAGERRMGVMI